ncbi:MAG: carboxylase, partial [Desulfobacterales bacterium]|nr:carboxylase [Desulfobacterales bacterium]
EVLEPEMDKAIEEIGDLAVDLDDQVLYAIYPVTGKKFLQWKYGKEEAPDEVKPTTLDKVKKRDELIKKAIAGELVEKKADTPDKSENVRTFNVFVDNEYFEVEVDATGAAPVINYAAVAQSAPAPAAAAPAAKPAAAAPAAAPAPEAKKEAAPAAAAADGTALDAPMPGMIVKYETNVGDTVNEGETVVILEAMKMENALAAPCSGTVKAIGFASGDNVAKGDTLIVIG